MEHLRQTKVSYRTPTAATLPELKLRSQPSRFPQPTLIARPRMENLADRDQLSDGVSEKRFIACCAINQPGY